jgi:hypothetical protein
MLRNPDQGRINLFLAPGFDHKIRILSFSSKNTG